MSPAICHPTEPPDCILECFHLVGTRRLQQINPASSSGRTAYPYDQWRRYSPAARGAQGFEGATQWRRTRVQSSIGGKKGAHVYYLRGRTCELLRYSL
jgi:hypothetical protein